MAAEAGAVVAKTDAVRRVRGHHVHRWVAKVEPPVVDPFCPKVQRSVSMILVASAPVSVNTRYRVCRAADALCAILPLLSSGGFLFPCTSSAFVQRRAAAAVDHYQTRHGAPPAVPVVAARNPHVRLDLARAVPFSSSRSPSFRISSSEVRLRVTEAERLGESKTEGAAGE